MCYLTEADLKDGESHETYVKTSGSFLFREHLNALFVPEKA